MKKIILSLCLVLFVSSAYAGSCPMMANNVDDKIKKAQELRDEGKLIFVDDNGTYRIA